MMQNLETEIAKTYNAYTLMTLLYHVLWTYLPRQPSGATYEFTEEGKQQYLELVDYAVRIYNATHQDQLEYEYVIESLRELADRFYVTDSKRSFVPQ